MDLHCYTDEKVETIGQNSKRVNEKPPTKKMENGNRKSVEENPSEEGMS